MVLAPSRGQWFPRRGPGAGSRRLLHPCGASIGRGGEECQLSSKHQTTRAAEFESLAAFRDLIDTACSQHPEISEQVCYDLKLAVDEACTNIITHGYAGMNPGSIILTLELDPQQVLVTLTDFGHPFEPSEPPAPDMGASLEDLSAGGFGLFIIYQTMDKVGYRSAEDGNHLTFVKRLHSSHSE
jgi:serine/threonine-protein kinase RsbW